MPNRITSLFERKQNNILSIYFTAGYPALADTMAIIETLEKSGVDLIEIGMPFSDPLADGPVIQESSMAALRQGMSIPVLFDQIRDIRKKISIPLILMGYINPVMQYGVEKFVKKASEIGIDGVIIPDLPLQEYIEDYKSLFEANGLKNIFLITPQTSPERIRLIDEVSDGFIYMVSSASTTGTKSGIEATQTEYFERVKHMRLRNPRLIGFGISDKKSFERACEYAQGAIIGTAFIKALHQTQDVAITSASFIRQILD